MTVNRNNSLIFYEISVKLKVRRIKQNKNKFNATIECGSGKRGTFAGVNFGSKTTASSSPYSGSVNNAQLMRSNKQLENGKGTFHKLTEADDE